MKPATFRLVLPLAAAIALAACKPAEDPAAIAARQQALMEQAADEAAQQFDAEYGRHNWELAKAHGDVLIDKYPDSTAAARIKERHADAVTKATEAREQRRLASLWSYGNQPVGKGRQLSASIYSQEPVDTDGSGAHPVRLIFRDHPEWGRSSYLVLEAGDFDCYKGCRLKVIADGKTHTLPGSRPKTDDAIAMFIEDWKGLWKLAKSGKQLSIEFPTKAVGKRTAEFEVSGLDPANLPKWN